MQLLVSESFEPLIRKAWEWIASRDHDSLLLVVPVWGCGDDFVRWGDAPKSSVSSFHRKTLLQLASEVSIPAMAMRGFAPVTGLAVEALCARAINDALQAGDLHYFRAVADTPGMSRALARTISELRLQDVDFDGLSEIGEAGQDLNKFVDLKNLADRFQGYLEADGLADAATTYRLACQSLEEAPGPFAGLPLLLCHLRPLTPLEAAFLARLAEQSSETLALALKPDEEGGKILREILKTEPVDLGEEEPRTRLQRLRRYLFSTTVPAVPASAGDEGLEFFSAPGESRECVEIARRISRAAAEGFRFDEIAVAVRDPESYLPLLEDAFRRAGIDAYFSRGVRRPDPAGRAFLALLECAAEGMSASRFAEYLSLAQIPPRQEAPAETVEWVQPRNEQLSFKTPLSGDDQEVADELQLELSPDEASRLAGNLRAPERWEQLLVDAAVIGGRERWERRLSGLGREIELQISGLRYEEVRARQHLQRKLFLLRNLTDFCLPLIRTLDDLPGEGSWRLWIDHLEHLATRALKHPHSVLSVLGELKPMGKIEPVTLDEVRRVLRDRLTLLREEPPANRYGRVLVASIPELWGRCFRLVFLPGLAEGTFPRKPLEDPLLLDSDRESLGIVPVLTRRRAEERLLLRVAVAAAMEGLIVSYPRVAIAEGRPRVPSFYALDILRAADGKLPDLRTLEEKAAETSSNRLGWPAPRQPEVAIDDTEFDLALLHPMLRLGPEQRRGRAQFLLKTNPHLARSLRARAGRWRPGFYPSDGLVEEGSEVLSLLSSERLRQRSYSPTSLQQFAVCPYKFFLYAVHRLRVRESQVALQELDPLTRGSIFHRVQFVFLSELRDRGLLPVTRDTETTALDHLDSVFKTVATSMEDDLAPAIPRIWESEMEELLTDLRGWLRETARSEEAWTPTHFELAFGLSPQRDQDPESASDSIRVLNGMRLRGSIDLVERTIRADGKPMVRVTDHKTGKPPYSTGGYRLEVGGGEILQPLVYGLAAEQLLGEEVEYGQLYYCTRKGEYQRRVVSIHSGTCGKLKQVLETIDRSLEKGFLPAAPRDNACRFCDFKVVCGPYEETRVKRKDQSRLLSLSELRKLP